MARPGTTQDAQTGTAPRARRRPRVLRVIGLFLAVTVACEFLGAIILKQIDVALLRERTRGKLVLTYDDGPGLRLEDRLLDLLRQEKAHATFFLNAQQTF